MNLVEHRPFVSAEDAIRNETDMVSDNILIETAKRRILVADTDIGRELKESIGHLEKLLNAYRDGILIEKESDRTDAISSGCLVDFSL